MSTPHETKAAQSLRNTLGRSEAAKRLGCSLATVRRLDASGELRALELDGHHGARRYARADVDALARSRRPASPSARDRERDEGARAAHAVRLARDGASLAEIVLACQVTPERARAWAATTYTPGALVVEGEPRAKLGELLGEPLKPARLVAVVERLLRESRRLRSKVRDLETEIALVSPAETRTVPATRDHEDPSGAASPEGA